jgi:hypothetical protein
MAIEAQTISAPTIEQPALESATSLSWQEIASKTLVKGSEKLNQLSVHISRRTWDFFAETAYNSLVGIPSIVKTASIHGIVTAGALIAETAYAPPEHQFQWYVLTAGLGGTLLGLSILSKVLPD